MNWHLSFLKKHLPWMLASYALVAFFIGRVVAPQVKLLEECRGEKNRIEYDYLRLKNSPGFVATVGETVLSAKDTLAEFEWLHEGYDPNLRFFERVSVAAERAGAVFTRLERLDNRKDLKYYAWNADFQGRFNNLCGLLHALEEDPRYLRIDTISVQPGEEAPFFTVTILGIRYLE